MSYEVYNQRVKEEIFFKIESENKALEIFNHTIPLLEDYFKDKQNKQILKSSSSVTYGELFKKYKDDVNKILDECINKFSNDDININLYLSSSIYNIYLEVRLRYNNKREHGFLYYDTSKYIISIEELRLKEFIDFKPFEYINKEDTYNTFLECIKLKEEIKEKEKTIYPYSIRSLIK